MTTQTQDKKLKNEAFWEVLTLGFGMQANFQIRCSECGIEQYKVENPKKHMIEHLLTQNENTG